MIRRFLAAIVLAMLAGCAAQPAASQGQTSDAKVILIIADGMDDQQIAIARNYLVGMNGRLVIDAWDRGQRLSVHGCSSLVTQ